jgi:predicted N-acyltransferase
LESAGVVVRHGQTVSVDLSLSVDEMWRQTRRGHRKQINQARRADVSVVMDDWDRLDEWVVTYHDNMRRVGASEYYFFSREYFGGLHQALGDRAHLAVAVAHGEVVGGSLFFAHRGIMQGHLRSTRDEGAYHADKLLHDEVRRWGKGRGNAVYHFGGGVGGAHDSLFAYKAGFSPLRHDFHTWRVVTDADRYVDLVGPDPAPFARSSMSGYFPPYR